jgi:hypothetical protein
VQSSGTALRFSSVISPPPYDTPDSPLNPGRRALPELRNGREYIAGSCVLHIVSENEFAKNYA